MENGRCSEVLSWKAGPDLSSQMRISTAISRIFLARMDQSATGPISILLVAACLERTLPGHGSSHFTLKLVFRARLSRNDHETILSERSFDPSQDKNLSKGPAMDFDRRKGLKLLLAGLATPAWPFPSIPTRSRQSEEDRNALARFIDELEASISPGQADVWERLIDPECLFVDENGKLFDKPAMVADIRPHPPDVYADIVSRNVKINIIEQVVAIVSLDADEHETFYGHRLHAIYRSVFTWFRRAHGWCLIGGQTMALLFEPLSLPLSSSALAEYTGTYEVSPQLAYVITQRGHELWGEDRSASRTAQGGDDRFVLFSAEPASPKSVPARSVRQERRIRRPAGKHRPGLEAPLVQITSSVLLWHPLSPSPLSGL